MDVECVDETPFASYLNRADIRQALNIPENVEPWNMCRCNYFIAVQSI